VNVTMKLMDTFGKPGMERPNKQKHAGVRGEEPAPKNGPLTLAVIGSVILMVVLGTAGFRLVSDPSVANKAFRSAGSARTEPVCPVITGPIVGSSVAVSGSTPPEVTFYQHLTVQDEQTDARGNPSQPAALQNDVNSTAPARVPESEQGKQGKKPNPESGVPPVVTLDKPTNPLRQGEGAKTYTVQVGAFTNPGIAQQWALKWKARGYDVSLKPVARPGTGVIYRLYLGRFSSEKKADDLVNRLKSREGISAFRLVVRN